MLTIGALYCRLRLKLFKLDCGRPINWFMLGSGIGAGGLIIFGGAAAQ